MSNNASPRILFRILGSALLASSAVAQTTTTASTGYFVHNLVSDLPGIADHQDPKLINPWGNGFSATSPFWIGNNGSGTSTLYDGTGAATALVVTIPQAGGAGTAGPVTGVIFNSFSANTSAFTLAAGKPASFMFCSLDGVISGWNSTVDATNAHILFDNSKTGASYDGCVLGGTATAPLLFAANFNAGRIDVYDATMNLNPGAFAKAFVDPAIPAGYAPYNIVLLNGAFYVAYAQQDSKKQNSVPGAGNGYLATFDQNGNLIATLISQGALNAPWGIAIAPASFGTFGGALLVGNFGDGTINAFNVSTGKQMGTLADASNKTISIQGLWSLEFGPAKNADAGTLYFTAGPGGGPNNTPIETHGLFGSIQAAPFFSTTGIANAASLIAGPIAPNTWATIKGNGLSATTVTNTAATLPTQLGNVSVMINNEAAPMNFVSNTQVNFLVPADIPTGTAQIVVKNNGLASASVAATVNSTAPAFFTFTGGKYIAAEHANGSLLAPAGLLGATTTTTPANPGEIVVLYGTGFGPNTAGTNTLPVMPTIVIDGYVATVDFSGMVTPGLYQFNVTVPTTVASGDVLVVALLGNAETQAGTFISIAAH